MIPILYPSSYKDLVDFNNNGLGFLTEATKVQVSEDLNGTFDVYIEYPISGRLFRDIASDTFVKVKPNSTDEPHIFRIYETEIQTERGIVSIEGTSITFDLVGNMVLDVTVSNATPADAWRALESGAVDPIKHRFNSDITTRSKGEWIRTNLLYCISGEEGSMLQKWGGEIKRENFQISLFRRRGRDNVTTIRHGKNMKGFTATYSTKGIVTAIVPVTTIYNEDSTEPIELVGDIVYSPIANKYPIHYYNEVVFTEEDGVVDLASLNSKAARFFTERPNHDKPSINVVIDMIDLSDSPEFYKFKDFENVEIGDTVTVYSKQFDMNLTSKVISIVYNALLEINESIELGTSRASAYDYYKQISKDTVFNAVKPIDERINLVQIAANGKNRIFRGIDEPTTGMFKNDIWYQPVGDGETMMYVFDGAYWQLNKISAGLLGGTLDAENGDVNLINVNVANIVGETSSFVQSSWNNISTQISIDDRGINIIGSDQWRRTYFRDIGFDFFNGSSADNKAGAIGYFKNHVDIAYPNENVMSTGTGLPHLLGIGANLYHDVALGYNPNTSQERIFQPALRIRGNTGDVHFYTRFTDGGTSGNFLSLDASPVKDRPGMTIRNDNAKLNRLHFGNFSLHMEATSNIDFWTESKNTMTLRDVIHARTNIQMNGNDVVGNSDERLKKNIVDSNLKALEHIDAYNFVEFEWKDENRPEGKHFGLIAQNTPFISEVDNDDVWNINLSKQTMVTTKGVQEVHQELKETKQELADLKALLVEKGVI